MCEELKGKIRLSEPVLEIEQNIEKEQILVRTRKGVYRCKKLIVTAPPRTLRDIKFVPALPAEKTFYFSESKVYGVYFKLIAFFEKPFWKEQGLTGFVFVQHGLLINLMDGETDPSSK